MLKTLRRFGLSNGRARQMEYSAANNNSSQQPEQSKDSFARSEPRPGVWEKLTNNPKSVLRTVALGAAIYAGHAVAAATLGTAGLLLVPAATVGYLGCELHEKGTFVGTRLEDKRILAVAGAAATLAVAASLTTGLGPALLLAKVGVPKVVGAAATGGLLGLSLEMCSRGSKVSD